MPPNIYKAAVRLLYRPDVDWIVSNDDLVAFDEYVIAHCRLQRLGFLSVMAIVDGLFMVDAFVRHD